jgi:hypothetical protein
MQRLKAVGLGDDYTVAAFFLAHGATGNGVTAIAARVKAMNGKHDGNEYLHAASRSTEIFNEGASVSAQVTSIPSEVSRMSLICSRFTNLSSNTSQNFIARQEPAKFFDLQRQFDVEAMETNNTKIPESSCREITIVI